MMLMTYSRVSFQYTYISEVNYLQIYCFKNIPSKELSDLVPDEPYPTALSIGNCSGLIVAYCPEILARKRK